MPPRFSLAPRTAFACLCWITVIPVGAAFGQVQSREIVQAEVDRCERNIRAVRVEIGNRYEKKLAELKIYYQKMADLEGALAVRAEEQRVAAEAALPLDGRHVVAEPKALRDAQSELVGKQGEMLGQIVQEALPKLVEFKKTLTMAGRLDEAVEVRSAIQRLQDLASPAQRLNSGSAVTAEEVYLAYQSSKERADKVYRGVKLLIRGRVAGVRPDPRDPSLTALVLYGGTEGALLDCVFASPEYRVREERQGQNLVYVVAHSNADTNALRIPRGGVAEFTGRCDGLDGSIRFSNCALQKY